MKTNLTRTGKLVAAALVLCLAGGCRKDPPPPSDVAQAESAPAPSSAPTPSALPTAEATADEPTRAGAPLHKEIAFNLDDASIKDVLEVLHQLSGKPVEITPEAKPIVDCGGVTIHNPDKVPAADAVNQIVRAVRASGLIVERVPTGWKVRAAKDAPPCAAKPGSSAKSNEDAVSGLITEIAGGIRSPSEDHFDVTDASRQLILGEQKELFRKIRWIPELEGDAEIQVGVRIFGVRKAGMADRLGFENGDRIVRVATIPLTSPANEAKAIQALRTAKQTTIDIIRRGKPLTLHYRIAAQ
jgi:hypothetical protein